MLFLYLWKANLIIFKTNKRDIFINLLIYSGITKLYLWLEGVSVS
jgi:hypothetical protein